MENSLLENSIQKDKELLIYLNNLGNEHWDSIWLVITNQLYWTPLFLLVFYLTIKTFGWKQGGFFILSMIVLVAFSDQFTNLIKNYFQRLRPNNDPEIKHLLRILLHPQSYSFISGHATTSTFFSVYIILLLKEKFTYIYFILLFPLVFAYSRLYLGVHFPLDIIVGILTGFMLANFYFYGVNKLHRKLFS